MEIVLAWFWLVKLGLSFTVVFCIYRYIKSEFKSAFWFISSLVGITLFIITPIKLETNTREVQIQQNEFIKTSKQLPPKIKDDSFKQSTQNLGINEKELP